MTSPAHGHIDDMIIIQHYQDTIMVRKIITILTNLKKAANLRVNRKEGRRLVNLDIFFLFNTIFILQHGCGSYFSHEHAACHPRLVTKQGNHAELERQHFMSHNQNCTSSEITPA